MSSLPFSAPAVSVARRETRAVDWKGYLPVALAAIVISAISNVVVYFLGDAVVGYNKDFVELGSAVGIAFSTAVPALIAALLYAGLLKFSNSAVKLFSIISAAVFVVTLIPDFTFIPGEPGASNGQTATLVLMHVVAAAVIVRTLIAFPRD